MSVRFKILTVVLGFFALVALAFFFYSSVTTEHYRELRIGEVSKLVELESEKVGRSISNMERTAVHFAMLGEQVYNSRRAPEDMGRYVSVEDFGSFRLTSLGVGGGIWFEPYVLREDARYAGVYAFVDPETGLVRPDPEFMSEEYDYHSRQWYVEIAEGLGGRFQSVWTAPYFEEIGVKSLLTTVGAGIYDSEGNFVGMATADWRMQNLIDSLGAIKPTRNSFVLLASPVNDYIITETRTDDDNVGESLGILDWYGGLRFEAGGTSAMGRFTIDGVEYISFSSVFDNGWVFSIQVPSGEIFEIVDNRNTFYSFLIGILSFVLLGLAFCMISYFVNRPLKRLALGVAGLGDGNLDRKIDINTRDEIGMLAAAFNKMTVELKASVEQNARERAEKERIGTELSIAATIQANMLPNAIAAFPERHEFDVYAFMRPAREVGGDFFDFFMVDQDTLAVVIADVSGKGVPAALFMVIAKTLIKNNAQYGKSPAEVFETVNDLLAENNEASMFVTAFLGYLDIPSGRFIYVSGGHDPPLIKRAGGSYEKLPLKPGLVLAGMGGMVYRQQETVLREGDKLFLYTDGVTEAANTDGGMFTVARLIDTANRNKAECVTVFVYAIRSEIDAFADGAEQADDITMMVLRVN